MAKNSIYAIKSGVDPETGLEVKDLLLEKKWSEVEPFIKGVKGAVYKGFKTKGEAISFLAEKEAERIETLDPNILYAYVDGSFDSGIKNYSFGLVCVLNGKVIHVDYGKGTNPDAVEMHQVGGELLGAMKALLFAKKSCHSEIVIMHDYIGVANHATGEWKRSSTFSKTYYEWMQKFFAGNSAIQVSFSRVDAHTGDDFNELADGYAKLALGIKPDPVFYRMVEKYKTTAA